jgi:hypothetical protein
MVTKAESEKTLKKSTAATLRKRIQTAIGPALTNATGHTMTLTRRDPVRMGQSAVVNVLSTMTGKDTDELDPKILTNATLIFTEAWLREEQKIGSMPSKEKMIWLGRDAARTAVGTAKYSSGK